MTVADLAFERAARASYMRHAPQTVRALLQLPPLPELNWPSPVDLKALWDLPGTPEGWQDWFAHGDELR